VVLLLAAVAAAVVGVASASAQTRLPPAPMTEVVVTLKAPPLAEAIAADRGLYAAATTRNRLALRAPASLAYLARLATAQRAVATRTTRAIPGSFVRWRYGVV